MARGSLGGKLTVTGLVLVAALIASSPASLRAEREEPRARLTAVPSEVTFTKHIAPILQRSCQNCHRPSGVAPMPLATYEEARPWARAIKNRTGLGPRAGVMPPWYIEKNIGIQHYKDDVSLSDVEIATVAKWADTGALRGNPDRHAGGAQLRRRERLAYRHAGSGRVNRRDSRQERCA